ncbi:Uncharacterized protein (Fragment) [Durusdinium trenchii]|uniref:Uncharacterized protein n=1 Tax=Durusdinium trenchii TaxID=1381693 RepID=A0ABP0QYI8_9DINO
MPLTLKKLYHITFEGDKWHVPENMVVEKLGKEWLLMVPSNYALCKLVQGGKFDYTKKFSLKNINMFDDLVSQRNAKSSLTTSDDLFGGDGKPQPKRKRPVFEDQELTLDLPAGGGTITCLNASKITDALAVEMDEANLHNLFACLHGSDTSSNEARSYQTSGKYKGLAAKRKCKKNDNVDDD